MSKLIFAEVEFDRNQLASFKSKEELKAHVSIHWSNRRESAIDKLVSELWDEIQVPVQEEKPKAAKK